MKYILLTIYSPVQGDLAGNLDQAKVLNTLKIDGP